MYVTWGGTVNNITINSGGSLIVSAGGKITGLFRAESGASVSFYNSSILNFDITSISPGAAARAILPSNLSVYPLFTLTISGSQKNGIYKLAENAGDFNRANINPSQTISVVNASNQPRGTLEVGKTVKISGVDYTLSLNDGLLSVQVRDPEVASARGDRDGNGVSDVMFVWTGNNYAHGYWMNGSADWWSSNAASISSDWENLGSYDMSGDGKADAVMVGNVTLNGVKGAYIGYYQNGDDVNGWVNIGYLNNAENIAWENKVGNLTGNSSGVNSIVWYAPELYALGVWTDGTDTWRLLSGFFGGDQWTLIGCGDFDGDGKDSVVMAQNKGAKYYTVDLDSTTKELATSDSGWEVRAIGDFAGDGRDDIVAFHAETGLVAMWGDGDSANKWSQLGQLDAKDWFVVGCGDYDGDQKDDLLVRQYSTGMLGYYSAGSMSNWVELGRGVDMQWTVIA